MSLTQPRCSFIVTSDVIVESSPPSFPPIYCQICNVAIRPSTYRLRLIDSQFSLATSVATMYHVHCFETTFDLEQPSAFGRIYPAPSSFPFSSGSTHPGRLDDDARALVNVWKLQRRREGLESAAGPDSGIRIAADESWSCACALGAQESVIVSTPRKVGEKRSNRVMEAEVEERKRAKYYTSDDGYGPRGPNSLLRRTAQPPSPLGNLRPAHPVRSYSDMGPGSSDRCGCPSFSNQSQRGAEGSVDLSYLPLRLSDALQRLEVRTR